MLKELIQLQKNGTLSKMVKAGIVSYKVNTYLEIYLFFDARKKTTDKTTNEIVLEASKQFKVSRSTVFRSIKIASTSF